MSLLLSGVRAGFSGSLKPTGSELSNFSKAVYRALSISASQPELVEVAKGAAEAPGVPKTALMTGVKGHLGNRWAGVLSEFLSLTRTDLGTSSHPDFRKLNVAEAVSVADALHDTKPDLFIHNAAFLSGNPNITQEEMNLVNVNPALIAACSNPKIKVFTPLTYAQYSKSPDQKGPFIVTEDTPFSPPAPYGTSKQVLHNVMMQRGVDFTGPVLPGVSGGLNADGLVPGNGSTDSIQQVIHGLAQAYVREEAMAFVVSQIPPDVELPCLSLMDTLTLMTSLVTETADKPLDKVMFPSTPISVKDAIRILDPYVEGFVVVEEDPARTANVRDIWPDGTEGSGIIGRAQDQGYDVKSRDKQEFVLSVFVDYVELLDPEKGALLRADLRAASVV